MYGVDEFLELIKGRGSAVEFGEGRIDIHEIKGSKGAAVLTHTGEGGGCGMNGKKLDDMAAEVADDEVELFNEVAKGAGGREYGIICLGELIHGVLVLGLYGVLIAGGTKETNKGGINRVIGNGFGGFNFDDGVASLRPMKGLIRGAEIGFGFISSDVGEREGEFPDAFWIFLHGNVMPVAVEGREVFLRHGGRFLRDEFSSV